MYCLLRACSFGVSSCDLGSVLPSSLHSLFLETTRAGCGVGPDRQPSENMRRTIASKTHPAKVALWVIVEELGHLLKVFVLLHPHRFHHIPRDPNGCEVNCPFIEAVVILGSREYLYLAAG
jgi:hypothetical protein